MIRVGEVLKNRYRVEEKIGRGVFGEVVKAYDLKTNTYVAIKIIKNHSRYRKLNLQQNSI